ncbi:UDP-N-acetylglucosamine 4,6-dehydratase (inverting) [Pelagibacteraceae bacterium]|nr:UDP-N-acetylglucosamine 4,6-dehydratase (inverting) [Pelagibacteraceae bacterium]
MFNSKVILITGGTGSFGKSCVEFILNNYKPKKVIVFSRDELKQYEMYNALKSKGVKDDNIRFFIGDVRDQSRLNLAFKDVDFVIHAAALKQIPAAEYNPQECIKTNIDGASNVIFAALEQGVKKVIALSTDKACGPVNLYGATKLASDKLFVSANMLGGRKKDTRFSVVRYGNVINSRGSVIPLFKKLHKEKKKTLPITDEKMTRFFIDIESGIRFVLKSFQRMHGGEIFVPKLPSIFIKDIVKAIDSNLKYHTVGVRPGEKLHETLCTKDESRLTIEFKDHYVIEPSIWTENVNVKTYLKNNILEKGKKVAEDFEYNSLINKDRLGIKEIKRLLQKI